MVSQALNAAYSTERARHTIRQLTVIPRLNKNFPGQGRAAPIRIARTLAPANQLADTDATVSPTKSVKISVPL